jgi:hypothetical protein
LRTFFNASIIPGVLWWFEREGLRTTIEVLHLANGEYEMRFLGVDGVEQIEHFTNAADLAKRQQTLHDTLIATGWSRSGEWLL